MKRILLSLVLVALALGTWAQNLISTITQDNVTYELYDDGTAIMTKHSTPDGGTLLIPETVQNEGVTYTITKIADKAISEGYAKKVIVRAKVKSLGAVQVNGDFLLMTSVEEIELPETLERIEDYQFCRTKIKSISIPASVKYIGVEAFYESSIESVVIPEGIETLEMGVFGRCSNLKSVTLPKTLKTIKGGGYIYFTADEKRYCDSPFYACSSLTEIVIPDNVTSIDEMAFVGCNSMKRFVVNNNATFYAQDGVLMQRLSAAEGGGIKLMQYPASRENSEYTVPEGVTQLGSRAFYWYNQDNLKVVNLPSTLVRIDGFKSAKIETLNIAEGPTDIAANAFEEAKNMNTLTLPSTIKSIGAGAFYNTGMQHIYVKANTPPTLDLTNVYNSKYDVMFCVNASAVKAYKNATGWKNHQIVAISDLVSFGDLVYLKQGAGQVALAGYNVRPTGNLVIPASINVDGTQAVTAVLAKAFEGTDIASVTIPASVETIGEDAFDQCPSLKKCEFAAGSRLQSIGRAAFSYGGLCGVVALPPSLKTITDYAFCATNIEAVTFGESSALESVGYNAFYGCRSLKHVELGAMVKLGYSVFENCFGLQSFVVDANNPYYQAQYDGLYSKDGKTLVVNLPGSDQDKVYFTQDDLNIQLFLYNYTKPKDIYILSKNLPRLQSASNNVSYGMGYYGYAKAYVRASLVDELKNEIDRYYGSEWGRFIDGYNIIAVPEDEADAIITGIETPRTSVSPANRDAYYTLDGKRIAHPQKGIYILNGRKVVVK